MRMDENQSLRNATGAEMPGSSADLTAMTWTVSERESISNQQLLQQQQHLHPGLMMAPMQHQIQAPEIPGVYPIPPNFQPLVLPQFSAPLLNPTATPCVQQNSAHSDNVLIRPNEFIVAEFNQGVHPLTVSFHSPCYPGLFPWQSGEPVGMQLYQVTRSSKEKQEENDIQENNSDNKTTIPQIHENVDGRGNGDKEDRDRGEGKTPETESSSPWEYLDKLFSTDDFLRNLELKQITETQLDSPDCSEPETSELLPQTEPEEQLELIQTTETPLDDANGSDPEPYEFLPLTDPDEQLFDEMWRELSLEKEDNIQPARATCQQLSDGTEEETAAGLRNDRALEKEAGEQCITIDFNFFTKLETALAALTETPPEISESNKCKVKRQEVGAAQTKIQQLEEEKSEIKAKHSLRDDEESKDLTECPANIGMVSENWSPISLLMSQRSPEFKTSTKDNIKVDRSGKKASAEAMLGDSAEHNHPVMSPEKNCEKNPKSSLILHPELTREDQRQSQTAAPKEDKAERKGEITERKTYNFSQKDLQDNHPLLKTKLLSEKSPKLSSIPHQEFVLEDPRQSQTAAQRVDKVERRRNKSKDSKIKPYWQEPDGSRESSVSEVEKAETQSEILERPLKRKQTAEAEVDSKRAKELTPAQAEEDLEKCEDMDQTFEMDMPSHETGGKTKSHIASYSSGLTEQETFTGERSAEQKAADMEALAACRRSQRGKDPCENQPQLVKRLPTNTECKGEKTKGKTGKGTQRGRKKTEIQGKKDEN